MSATLRRAHFQRRVSAQRKTGDEVPHGPRPDHGRGLPDHAVDHLGYRFDRMTLHPLGRLDLGRIDSQAQRVRRTETDIARSPRTGFYANLQVRGECVTTQDGRTTVTRPGDLTIVDTSRPFTFEFSDDFRQLSLHLPGALLPSQVEQPIRTAIRVGTATGVGAAVRHALHAIDAGRVEPGSTARLAVHAAGLLAIVLEQPEPVGPTVRRHSHMLDAALADIDEHLADDDLSPTTTAARLGISVRLLHQVFARHDHTYRTQVRRRRLDQAHRDLADPARAGLRIIDVAADAGFGDVTHFHRAFRQTYGYTPAHVRAGPAS